MRNVEKPVFSIMVKKTRKQCGWTQAKLAELLGVDVNTVSRWERGEHLPKEAEIIEKLCGIFQMTPEALGLLEEKPCFFLSFVQADAVFAERLRADLQCRDITIYDDEKLNTTQRQETLRTLFRKTRAMILVASADVHRSASITEELELAQRCECPVYILWRIGRRRDALTARQIAVCSIDARDAHYATALDELVTALKMLAPRKSTFEPRNPYKGLFPFHSEDVQDFFGRERLIDNLADRLEALLAEGRTEGEAARLLSVVGPSGSGKSSVVMAGLLPRLRADEIPGSEHWVYLPPMTPGGHPLEALAVVIADHLKDRSHITILQDLWDKEMHGFHLLMEQLTRQQKTKVVLVVDQFEELFARVTDEQERRQFIDLLVRASKEPNGSVIVILTLRADFYDRVMLYPFFYQLFQAHLVPVLPMEKQELRQVIEKPTCLPDVSMKFEGDLISDILSSLEGQSGALPLLEFTLDQLFQRREGHWLTHQAYQAIGEVKGAVAKHAESTYASLPSEEHRRLARALFLRLIDPGTTELEARRRRAAITELSLLDPKQATIIQEAVNAFIAARLLATNEMAGIITVEVSHEALIREWERLSTWLHAARDDIRLQQTISEDTREWARRGKPKDRLYRGSQFKEASAWAVRNLPSRNEAAFLQASAVYRLRSRVVVTAIVLLVLLLLVPAVALVRSLILTNVVTIADDDGPGSLRRVIASASPGSTITFAVNVRGMIMLTSGDLSIDRSLTIRGPGAQALAISGGNSGHIVHVLPGITVSMRDLSFVNSNTGSTESGFIKNEGTLTLANSIISGNTSSTAGGGIVNMNKGKLTLIGSTVSKNRSTYGGGIYKSSSGGLTLFKDIILGNVATEDGGGIYDWGARGDIRTTITSCIIRGNIAHDGGGIFVDNHRLIEMRESQITGNHAPLRPDIAVKYG